MAVNRPLLARISYRLTFSPLTPEEAAAYLQARLCAVGIHSDPFEAAAIELIVAAADGLPRNLWSPRRARSGKRRAGKHRRHHHRARHRRP